ncbi:MAG: glycosyltransferase [Oscillibacter sp.]|nr:glycosyltransferase [Oscillibacter sp.]
MKILYALSLKFPFGRAYASRALNLCRALRDAGHEVSVFCDYLSEEVERSADGGASFEGLSVFTTYPTQEGIRSLKRRLFVSRDALRALDRLLTERRFDLILSSSTPDRFAGVLRLAKGHGVPLTMEICEWFDSYSWTYGKLDPRHLQCERCWKRSYPRADGVVAISRLLEKTFAEAGLPVIRIPTVLDISAMSYRGKADGEAIRLLFAGDISTGKDRLIEAIEAVSRTTYARPVTLDVYGPGAAEVAAQSEGALSEEDLRAMENVHIHGFRPQGEIHAKCLESDFGLILRPDRRSSNAGFPTKLAEYMAAGTPVIANDTGDIGVIIEDGTNGFIVRDIRPQTIRALLERITAMTAEELSAMRKSARKTAETRFDYRIYRDELSRFVTQVSESRNEGKQRMER